MADDEDVEQEQKGNNNLVLIVSMIAVMVVLVIGGLLVFLLMSDGSGEVVQPQSMQQSISKKSRSADVAGLVVGPMYPLDNFTVNLLSDSGRRFLKIQMNLELSGDEIQEEIDAKVPVIRDVIIRMLTSKTLEEVSTAKGKDKLKEQLLNEINLRIQDGYIQNIYFMEFVIQ